MRVRPRYHVGLIAVVGYSVLVVAAWGLLGVDYATISSTTENVVRGIVVPVGIGAAFLAGYTSWLRWWRPALREPDRVAPRWTLVVPVVMVVVALLNLLSADLAVLSVGYLVTLGVGTLLVVAHDSSNLVEGRYSLDGSALTNLAGYEVRYGRSASNLDQSVSLTNPSLNRYVVENLSAGTWYFAVVAVNTAGVASPLSNTGNKTIS